MDNNDDVNIIGESVPIEPAEIDNLIPEPETRVSIEPKLHLDSMKNDLFYHIQQLTNVITEIQQMRAKIDQTLLKINPTNISTELTIIKSPIIEKYEKILSPFESKEFVKSPLSSQQIDVPQIIDTTIKSPQSTQKLDDDVVKGEKLSPIKGEPLCEQTQQCDFTKISKGSENLDCATKVCQVSQAVAVQKGKEYCPHGCRTKEMCKRDCIIECDIIIIRNILCECENWSAKLPKALDCDQSIVIKDIENFGAERAAYSMITRWLEANKLNRHAQVGVLVEKLIKIGKMRTGLQIKKALCDHVKTGIFGEKYCKHSKIPRSQE